MNIKKYLPVIIIVLLLLIGGGLFLASQNKSPNSDATTAGPEQTQTQTGNVISSIKDALSKSVSLECSYNDETGSETKTYIKNGAVRADSKTLVEGTETNSSVIFKDKKMYTWDPAKKEGAVFEITDENMQEAQSPKTTPSTGSADDNKEESFLAGIEKYKDSCKPSVVSDNLFTPPTDVKFQDMSSLLKNIPTGVMPSGFNLEELQKKYAPEGQ